MHIHKFEKMWLGIGITTVVIFAVLVSVAGFSKGFQVPDGAADTQIDPNTLKTHPNFKDTGLRELAPGKYAAYIIAKTWSFDPGKLEVPVGSQVTFYVTSEDVQHGFWIQNTNVNMMVLPGRVSKLAHTFKKEGTFFIVCDEYCGTSHQNMFGEITVTPKAGGTK